MKSKSVRESFNPYFTKFVFFRWPASAIQLLVLLTLRPKRLNELFQHLLSCPIPPTSSLLEFSRQHILSTKLNRFLRLGFIALPLLATTVVGFGIQFFNDELAITIAIGSLFGVLIGILFAYVVGIAAGIGMAIATVIPLSWYFGYSDYVAMDLMNGNKLG